MDVMEFAGSALSGGIVGIIGSGLKFVGEYFTNKQKMEMQKITNNHELALIGEQSKLRVIEGEIEQRIVREKADGDIKTASYNVFTSTENLYKWAATLIGLNRVILTWLLWGLTLYVTVLISSERGSVFVNGKDLMSDIINNITFCAAAATLWWFGDRPPQKR